MTRRESQNDHKKVQVITYYVTVTKLWFKIVKKSTWK